MDPCQKQGQVGGWFDGQPVFGFAGSNAETGIHCDNGGTLIDGIGHLLNLSIVHIFTQVGSDQHQASGIPDIDSFRTAHSFAEGHMVGHLAGATTLRIGGSRNIVGSKGLQQGSKIFPPGAMC